MMRYLKIEGAEALGALVPLKSKAEFLGWHAAQIQARGIARVWHPYATVHARVDHGRWCADCPECGHGMFTHRDWRIACCGECGAVYEHVTFPSQVDEIEFLLLQRPRRENHNWSPGETVATLLSENLAHGVQMGGL